MSAKAWRVSTIEHVMAALWSCGVDNAVVEVDAPETPIMDGSAREYAEAIASVGLQEQDADRVYYDINEKDGLFDRGQKGSKSRPIPTTSSRSMST